VAAPTIKKTHLEIIAVELQIIKNLKTQTKTHKSVGERVRITRIKSESNSLCKLSGKTLLVLNFVVIHSATNFSSRK